MWGERTEMVYHHRPSLGFKLIKKTQEACILKGPRRILILKVKAIFNMQSHGQKKRKGIDI